MDFQTKKEIRYCLNLALEGLISDKEYIRLNQLLANDRTAQDYYLELLDINCALRQLDWTSKILPLTGVNSFDEDVWVSLASHEQNAPAIEVEKPETPLTESIRPLRSVECKRNPANRTPLIIVITSLAALLCFMVYLHSLPEVYTEPTAVLRDSDNARWANSALSLESGDMIMNTDKTHVLLSGAIKIETLLGPEVIIEGPAQFEFPEKDKVNLHSGRLYVKVPKNAIGYTVATPSFSVIDLGTEFGVKVDVDGTSVVHMFSGKASLVSGTQGQTRESQILTQGTARRILASSGQIEDIPFNPTTFIQELNTRRKVVWRGEPISLADIVGGGNGLGTGIGGSYLDPDDTLWRTITGDRKEGGQTLESTYRPVLSNDYIDGLFVPNGQNGPIEITSSGHHFQEVPVTSGRYWYGVICWAEKTWGRTISLDGVVYGTSQQPALLMHSNIGITFDLEAIRRDLPGGSITEFSSLYGLSDAYGRKDIQPYADFWVLVDGQLKFSRRNATIGQTGTIRIPLSESDRFLTLITTEGEKNVLKDNKSPIFNDWCVWGNPVLKIE
jgi:hypothetical protein